MRMRALALTCALVTAATAMSGCAVVALGTAGVVASNVAQDRRTVGTQLDDQNAENQVAYKLSQNEALKEQARLQVDVYNGVALLTGQAPSQQLVDAAQETAKLVPYIEKVHNQVRVGPPIDAAAQVNDLWLASKIKTQMLANEDVPSVQVEVIVQNGEVFLMGRVTNQEATATIELVRNVNGVKQVIRAFEICKPRTCV